MTANDQLPEPLLSEQKAFEEQFKAEEKAAKEADEAGLSGLASSDRVWLVNKEGQEYDCVVEAAPVWLAKGWKLKKNGN